MSSENKAKPNILNGTSFLIDERPIAVYGVDQQEASFHFMKSFDGGYWKNQLALVSSVGIDQINHDHLTFMRLTLSHAEEHFLALIFAYLQAPASPDLWLYHYRTDELDSLVKKVSNGLPILTRSNLQASSWEAVSKALWPGLEEKRYELTALVIKRLADHFLSGHGRGEYNSLKHGMRLSLGGHAISFAPSSSPDVKPPPEKYISFGDSKFGSRFYEFEKIERQHYFSQLVFSNWDREEIGKLLTHTVLLIVNMGAAFRSRNNLEGDLVFRFLSSEEAYMDNPRKLQGLISGVMRYKIDIPKSDLLDLTKVRELYKATSSAAENTQTE